jgi:U2 small nuclear ribonucleoprotein A'
MRLSAELLGSCEQRTNPIGEREIVMRGLAIPAIEHLAATLDAFDTMDLTDNRLARLDNFPRLLRLSSILASSNLIESLDPSNIGKNVPGLKFLELSYNQISSLLELSNLGKACTKLEQLNLTGNPVASTYSNALAQYAVGCVCVFVGVCERMRPFFLVL